jgi:hypothetical protein
MGCGQFKPIDPEILAAEAAELAEKHRKILQKTYFFLRFYELENPPIAQAASAVNVPALADKLHVQVLTSALNPEEMLVCTKIGKPSIKLPQFGSTRKNTSLESLVWNESLRSASVYLLPVPMTECMQNVRVDVLIMATDPSIHVEDPPLFNQDPSLGKFEVARFRVDGADLQKVFNKEQTMTKVLTMTSDWAPLDPDVPCRLRFRVYQGVVGDPLCEVDKLKRRNFGIVGDLRSVVEFQSLWQCFWASFTPIEADRPGMVFATRADTTPCFIVLKTMPKGLERIIPAHMAPNTSVLDFVKHMLDYCEASTEPEAPVLHMDGHGVPVRIFRERLEHFKALAASTTLSADDWLRGSAAKHRLGVVAGAGPLGGGTFASALMPTVEAEPGWELVVYNDPTLGLAETLDEWKTAASSSAAVAFVNNGAFTHTCIARCALRCDHAPMRAAADAARIRCVEEVHDRPLRVGLFAG